MRIKKIVYTILGALVPISSYAFFSQYDLSGFTRSTSPTAGALEGESGVVTFENIFTFDVSGVMRDGTPGAMEAITPTIIPTPVECVDIPNFTGQEEFNCYYANNEVQIPDPLPTCDVVFDDTDTWLTINGQLNGGDSDDIFCFRPGDYTALDPIVLSNNGTAVDKKWIRLYGTGTTHPVNLATQDKAILKLFSISGDYWVLHRLAFDFEYDSGENFTLESTAQNNLLNKLLLEKTNSSNGIIEISGADDLVIQNSVIRDTTWLSGVDHHCISMGGTAENVHIINNQVYDCAGDMLVTSNNSWQYDMIVEGNDLYITDGMYCDSDGTKNKTGNYSAAENAIDIKGGTISTNPIQIIHNRIWGFQDNDSSCGSSSGGGEHIIANEDGDGNFSSDYMLIANNIFTNGRRFFGCPNGSPDNISILANFFYRNDKQIAGTNNSAMVDTDGCTNMEIMWNTFIDATYGWVDLGSSNTDYRCNVFVDAIDVIGSPGSNNSADYNAFYNTTQWTTGSGDFCDGTNDGAVDCASDSDSRNTVLTYKRKRWVGTETATIPYGLTSTNSPHYNKATCTPGSVTNDPAIGYN